MGSIGSILSIFNGSGTSGPIFSLGIIVALGLFYWRIRGDFRRRDFAVHETHEVWLNEQRMKVYPALMKDLQCLSYTSMRTRELNGVKEPYLVDELRLAILKQQIENHIYGEFGLVASHEAREFLVWLRNQIETDDGTKESADVVRRLAWKVHQMLRADLGQEQPKLRNSLQKIRRRSRHQNISQIETLAKRIHHNRWHDHLTEPDNMVKKILGFTPDWYRNSRIFNTTSARDASRRRAGPDDQR